MIGYILAGIGIAIAIVFGLYAQKSRGAKEPVWAYHTRKVIGVGGDAPPQLRLTFEEQPINDLYLTTIVFYNQGRLAIRPEDVPDNEKVTFHFMGGAILTEPRVIPSKDNLPFTATRFAYGDDNCVELNFQYLEHQDGALIEVLHTEDVPIKLRGRILDAKKKDLALRENFIPYRDLPLGKDSNLRAALFFVVVAVAMLILFAVSGSLGENAYLLYLTLAAAGVVGLLDLQERYVCTRAPKWTSVIPDWPER